MGLALLLLAGCGGTPTAEPAGPETPEEGQAAARSFEDVYAEIEGLEAEERKQRLIELAQENGRTINVYSTMNNEEGPASVEEFQEQTGLEVAFYRASGTDVLNRVLEENRAGYDNPADVVTANGTEMIILTREDQLAPLDTVAADQLPEEGVSDTWAWSYLNVFTPMWNTDIYPTEQAPTRWRQLLTDYDGQLVMEVGDWDWFAGVVGFLEDEEGMTEDEAVQMVTEAAQGAAAIVDGHTVMGEFVASGQYGMCASCYHSTGVDLVRAGAPVAWEPPIDPLLIRPNGAGLNIESRNPAGAILFLDFFLTDAQPIMAEYGRQPANPTVEGGTLPPDYPVRVIDLETLLDEQDKWQGMYQQVIEGTGQEVQGE